MATPGGAMKSGDDLGLFFQAARESGAAAALINCVPCQGVDLALDAARDSGLPFGAYAHMGEGDPDSGWPVTPRLAPPPYPARPTRSIHPGPPILRASSPTTP